MNRNDGGSQASYDDQYEEVRNPYAGPVIRRMPLSPDDWRTCICIDHMAPSSCTSADGTVEQDVVMGSPLTENGYFMVLSAAQLRATAATFLRMADEAEGIINAD